MCNRVRCGIVIKAPQLDEEVPANNMGDGNIAIPEKPIKWKDDEELLKRYVLGKDGKPLFKSLKEFATL